jgi:pimeloyl-ACP methyl ester carboxylesterase
LYIKQTENSSKLAIVLPGLLDSKDYIHMTSLVDHLAKNGYTALSLDPPGTWESPYSIDHYTTTNTQLAVKELIDYFGKIPTVVIGHSRGGSNAMLAGMSNPEVTHFVAIMSHAVPSTLGKDLKGGPYESDRDLPPGKVRTIEKVHYSLPYSYFIDQAKYNAQDTLPSSTKKKLFFYGTHDALVSEDEVKETYELSADPKELVELDCEHDYRLHADAVEKVNNKIIEFLAA